MLSILIHILHSGVAGQGFALNGGDLKMIQNSGLASRLHCGCGECVLPGLSKRSPMKAPSDLLGTGAARAACAPSG